MSVRMPRIRLAQLNEVYIQRPVFGAFGGETTNDFLTETANAQMQRLISSRDQIIVTPSASAVTAELGPAGRFVGTVWSVRTIDKGDVVDLMYGT